MPIRLELKTHRFVVAHIERHSADNSLQKNIQQRQSNLVRIKSLLSRFRRIQEQQAAELRTVNFLICSGVRRVELNPILVHRAVGRIDR